MQRLKDILRRINGTFLCEIIGRRKDYYRGKWRSRCQRRKTIDHYLSGTRQPKLHLGCGGQALQGWLNSDIMNLNDGMIFLDVREKYPFEDDSFDLVYSEHLVEHLAYEDSVHYFKEAFRVLKPGGTCRTSTPDLSFLINLMQEDSEENRAYTEWAFRTYWPGKKPSRALAVNHYFRSWGHQCLYDYPLLKETYQAAGFREVRRVSVGESQIPELRGIEKHGDVIGERWNRKESLVVEGTKPGNPTR